MKIEKKSEILRNSQYVFNFLKITKNQDKFSVWNMTDPGMKKEYRGEDGKEGFVYCWDSENKNVGAGEQEITGIVEDKSIEYALRFFRPMQNNGTSRFDIVSLEDERTEVKWTFEAPSRFPMLLLSPLFKKILGKDLEKGLANLKDILENN